MKTIFFIISLLIFSFVYSQHSATIKGTVKNSPSKEVTIEPFVKGEFNNLQLPIVNNTFEVKVPVDDIEFLKLGFGTRTFLVIIAEPNDNIIIDVDLQNIINTVSIKGSVPSMQVYEMESKLINIQTKIEELKAELVQQRRTQTSPQVLQQFQHRIDSLQNIYATTVVSFIEQNIENPATMFFIEKVSLEDYYELYDRFTKAMSKKYPRNAVVKHIASKTAVVGATAIGAKVSNIVLPNVHGDTLSLFPIEGELVVIDFWASWCAPCRRANPSKVAAFEKYKDKGLVMFSVSLDQNANGWKSAIQSDNLNWKYHVSELKGWQSIVARQYGVSSIPANVIINKDGKILAKNVRGEEYTRFLENYFSE